MRRYYYRRVLITPLAFIEYLERESIEWINKSYRFFKIQQINPNQNKTESFLFYSVSVQHWNEHWIKLIEGTRILLQQRMQRRIDRSIFDDHRDPLSSLSLSLNSALRKRSSRSRDPESNRKRSKTRSPLSGNARKSNNWREFRFENRPGPFHFILWAPKF